MLVIWNLGAQNDMRFSELLRSISGISRRMLAKTLQLLEFDGLLEREVVNTYPPEVRYRLTPLGVSLCGPINALNDWANQSAPQVAQAREAYIKRQEWGGGGAEE